MLEKSDVVFLHTHVTDETRGMVDEEFLSYMKEGSYLINTARGELVDEEAIIESIKCGHLKGYGTDVIKDEFGDIQNSKLVKFSMNPNNNDATAINIPSIFIKASDGEKLKEYVENKTTTVKIVKQTNLLVSGVTIVPGMFFINDVVVRNNNGTSEIYVAAGSRKWDRVLGTRSETQNTIIGSGHHFIYKSTDGINWEKIELYYPIDENNSVHNATVVPTAAL